jgi:parallel beta-helix repeat protein
MKINNWGGVLLSTLVVTSLIVPLSIVASVHVTKATNASDLFISEYIEGTSYNKALEIFNYTGSSVDLSNYKLELYSNGSATVSKSITLSGTLANNDVWVGCHTSANDAIKAVADYLDPASNVFNWNGDDGIVLRKISTGSVVDAIGQHGVDPGTEWNGGGANHTQVRKATILQGDTNFEDAFTFVTEWDTYNVDNFYFIGWHNIFVPTYGVNVSISPDNQEGLPGQTLTYTVRVRNTESVPDNFSLENSDNAGWALMLDNDLLTIPAGENRTTTLRVTIPENAEDGAEDLITVTATSKDNENIKDNEICKAICTLVPQPKQYKEYPTDDQAVMENMGNLSENYQFKLPCGRYHLENCPKERSFLKFDISSIPPGAFIENAYLGLYHHFGVYTDGRWCWVEVWTVENDNWTENGIDWSNQPPKVEQLYQEYIDYTSYSPNPWLGTIHGWPGVPVTSYIQNEIADGAASFVLYSPQENVAPSENTDIDFTATEDDNYSTQWPYLEVWYYENAPTVLFSASISPSSQAGWLGDNLKYTVMVKNRGTINDNYYLVVNDNASPSWGPTLDNNLFLNVGPGENRTTTLRVAVPENEELATLDKITVTATSQVDNRISESAEAIATVSGVWIVVSNAPYIEDYAVAVVGAGENIYIANSGPPEHFMCYNSANGTWQNLSVPTGLLWQPGKANTFVGAFKNGTYMAWDNGDYIYTVFGASYADGDDGYYRNYFYRYSISNDNWEKLENTKNPQGQGAGDAITWVPGSAIGDNENYIFAIIGMKDHGSSFWRYKISTNTWENMAPLLNETDDGCSLVWTGGTYLYALRGEDIESSPIYDFWRYDIVNNTWASMAPIPAYPWGGGAGGVGDGGSLIWIGGEYSDYIYALSGNQCYPENPPIWDNRFYLYTISTNSWQRLADMPGGVGNQNGHRLGFASGSRGKIYCWRGCNGDPVLWAYMPTQVAPPSEVEVRLGPIDDSYVVEGSPTIQGLGDNYNFYVGWDDNTAYLAQRAYLKFNLSGIPSGSTILSATLYAYTKYGASNGPPSYDPRTIVIGAENVSNDTWNESTLCWDNRPPMGPTVLDSKTVDNTENILYSWDVTSYVQSELTGDKTASVGLISENENTDASLWFYSKDASYSGEPHPYLRIIYTLLENEKVPRGPIHIVGNAGFTPENGVNGGGLGTENDPYIIKNWVISASSANGIEIRNTTAYFVVRNCVVENGWIAENGVNYYGIKLDNVVNGRVENNTCVNDDYGILLITNSDNNIITNNTCENNFWYGIRLEGYSSNNTITNNTCENTECWGIGLDHADNNTLDNNTCENGGGIYLYDSENIKMRNNTLSNNLHSFGMEGTTLSHFIHDIDTSNLVNGKPIRYLIGHSNEVIGPSLEMGYLGLVNCDNIRVENLVLEHNVQGILIASTQDSRVENCVFENNSFGIYLWGSENNILTNNSCEDGGRGIKLLTSNNNILTNNTCEDDNYFGIQLVYSNNNTIKNSTFSSDNEHGVRLYSSDNNIIENNTISNDNLDGIWFESDSVNNIIRNNNLISNNRYGIYILASNDNNLIYHNNFLNNENQAYDSGSNYWDNGYPSGGNYWSDYTGPDANGDGIGDTPYGIPGGGNQDRYPLMNSWPPAWVNTGDLENARHVYSLLYASDGAVYAGTASGDDPWNSVGVVFKTTDGGTTWVPTASLGGLGVVGNIEAMVQTHGGTIDNNIIIGTAWWGKIFKTTNGGDNWIEVVDLTGVVEVDSLIQAANGDLYAGTHYSSGAIDEARIYRSTNYGDNWQVVAASSVDGELSGCTTVECLIQASTGYFYCGTQPGHIWRSNNGDNWYKVGDKDINFGGSYKMYSLLDASNGYIYAASRNPGNVYRSTDNGNTWTEVANGVTELGGATRTDALRQASNGMIYVGTDVGKIYRSTDGDNWVLEINLPAGRVNAIVEDPDDYLYAGTSYNGDVFKTYISPAQVCEVEVVIENELLEGWPSQILAFTINVYNSGNVVDNIILSYVPDGWPDITIVPPVLINVAPCEVRQATMFVHVPDNALPCAYKQITVVAESQFCGATDNDNALAHVVEAPPPSGKATFRLENLYKVSLEKDLQLYSGSKLVVKFYDYSSTFESEVVIETITPPQSVVQNENVPHPPQGSLPVRTAVKKAALVLTMNDTNNMISTIASWITHQGDLRTRYGNILRGWSGRPLVSEVGDILRQWSSAPT